MGYTQLTFDQLVTALSIRLSDPNKVFWLDAEMRAYLKESLRTWQAFSQFTSATANLNTATNLRFYDLFVAIPQLVPTITDRDIISDIQRHLQEPISPTVWTGTEQFTLAGLTQAIQKRRDRFLIETGLVQHFGETLAPPPPEPKILLDDSVIDVRRVMWKTNSGYTLLWPADPFMLTAMSQSWTTPGVPEDFSMFYETPTTLLVAPPPAAPGVLHLITVNSGPDLTPATKATILGIPDDLCWVVKFGALADLFGQDGPGQDIQRQAYCESRWKDGIKLARITNYVRLGYTQGTPAFVSSLEELDTTSPDWMNTVASTPEALAVSGNVLAVNPNPSGIYSLALQIIPKFPVPVLGTDFIQVGAEIIDVILDYAAHLADIKTSAGDIQDSMIMYQNMVKLAAVENDILRARATDFDVMSDRTTLESKERPRRRSDFTQMPQDYVQD